MKETKVGIVVQNNTITQNSIGVQINAAADYVLIYNDLQGKANYSLYVNTASDVNVAYNWWGTTATQAINQSIYDFKNDFTLGRANFVPFLDQENSSAPPVVPEASSPLVLSLFMVATLVASGTYFERTTRA